ncbi:MAG TPA: bifunctional 5,10-methylenetetrahydrofolate dehydrogenase/5,10-methenyltetrahydrofolate cyclohydrolase [Patescibacteria group bacterium]|nr:bifunctional 5,10-methylenetetrahydrofolate dehydrogenase/5,10-methenyltetrahydrofolate cyclohydrolase [Patescibacteria group bacterium]
MKLLNGKELAGYIKERQGREVRSLVQSLATRPKLAIVVTVDNPTINIYMRKKQLYGDELGIDVDVHQVTQEETPALLQQLNSDATVHGIIVQLPLANPEQTEEIVNLVAPEKDVDALGKDALFDPATPMAILWLLSGYNVELKGKQVLLVGRGTLVGRPLERILKNSNVDVRSVDRTTTDLQAETLQADIIITATGSPGLLLPDMIKKGAVVVDAGVASEQGKSVGDVAKEVYERDDLTITPVIGGVGPLTVSALFENVIRAARRSTET